MNRIPPDRSMPAVLLTDGPDTTATVHAHGWNITATIDTARAARLTHTMTGSRRALIWHGRGWTISLPLPAPETTTGTSVRQADATPTGHIPAVIPERPDAPTQQLPVICFASMSFQQAHQYFSAVWADGFPRSRHHAVSDVR